MPFIVYAMQKLFPYNTRLERFPSKPTPTCNCPVMYGDSAREKEREKKPE